MKRTIFIIFLFLYHSFTLMAQEKLTFSGKDYFKRNSKWYDKDGFEINNQEITIQLRNINEKDFLNQERIEILRQNYLGNIDIKVPDSIDIFFFANRLRTYSQIQTIEINTWGLYSTITTNDIKSTSQWYLNKIQLPLAWDLTLGKSCVTVAVLDSGTDWTHNDLGIGADNYQNIWINPGEDAWINTNDPLSGNHIDDDGDGLIDNFKGWNFANNTNDSRGSFYHGTHVAGIVSAKTNNHVGISGIAGGFNQSGVNLMPLCIGINAPNGAVIDDAILHAVSKGAKVIQLSLSVGQSNAIDAAILFAINNGVTIVCSSGNENTSIGYPASNVNVISVGATDQNDKKASFSNYGNNLTISAPGVGIYSTQLINGYGSADGTSFSAPIVSGVIALMLSLNSSLLPQTIKNIITSTADKVGGYSYVNGKSTQLGYGRINAFKCLKAISQTITGPDKICNNTATYQLSNVPNDATITWTANGALEIIGSSTTSSITVNKKYNGNGWLQVDISSACGNQILYKNSIVVGSPSSKTIFAGYQLLDPNIVKVQEVSADFFSQNTEKIIFHVAYVQGETYEWKINGVVQPAYGFKNDCIIQAPICNPYQPNQTEYTVELSMTNACGTTTICRKFVFYCTPSPYIVPTYNCSSSPNPPSPLEVEIVDGEQEFIISPNPSNNLLNVSQKVGSATEPEQISSTQSKKPFSLKLYDANGNLLKKGESKIGDEVGMDVSSIPNGTYFLHIGQGKKLIKKQVIIKH